jgi:TPR repeat protein
LPASPLRIFISSPGDVLAERRRAGLVLERLKRDYGRHFEIKPYLWEYEPMVASGHFQDNIESPAESDIVVLIVWSRLGTFLPAQTSVRAYRGIDDRTPVTGTEWEFETALAARQTRGAPDIVTYRKRISPSVPLDDPARKAAMEAQWESLTAFWKRHFADGDGFKAAFADFDDLDAFESRLESDLRALIESRIRHAGADAGTRGALWLKGNPYRGLVAYQASDAGLFFGRSAATQDGVERLLGASDRGQAFLMVLGASGSGKSSLVRAGLVPTLAAPGIASGVGLWRHAVMRPGGHEGGVFLALAEAMSASGALPEMLAPGQDSASLAAYLAAAGNDPAFLLGGAMNRVAEAAKASGRMLAHERPVLTLIVDQFEELFTDAALTPGDRAAFADCLDALSRSGHVAVVATMRSDFWHRAMELPRLIALVERGARLDLLAPLPSELGEIIRRPADAAGVSFERDPRSDVELDRVLAEDAALEPGALPLLSFLLESLFERDIVQGRGAQMTVASAAALGGLKGAIAARADAVLQEQPKEVQQSLPKLLRQLVQIRQGENPTARLAPLSHFPDASPIRRLADVLVSQAVRLLVADGDGAEPRLRIAHEALLSHWDVAADWVRQNRRDLETRARLEDAAALWAGAAQKDKKDRLLQGLSLAEANDLLRRWGDDLQGLRPFIETSDRTARAASRRGWMIAASVMVVLAGLSGAALLFGLEAESQRAAAEAAAEEAERNFKSAEENRALANQNADIANANTQIANDAIAEAERRAQEAYAQKARAEEEEIRALVLSAQYLASSAPATSLLSAVHAIRVSLDRRGGVSPETGTAIAQWITVAVEASEGSAQRSDIVYSAPSPLADRVLVLLSGRRTMMVAGTTGAAAAPLEILLPAEAVAAAFSNDGARVLAALEDGRVQAFDLSGGQASPAGEAMLDSPPSAILVAPFSGMIFVGLKDGRVARLAADLTPAAVASVSREPILLLSAAADGSQIFAADAVGAVYSLPASGAKAALLDNRATRPTALAASHDGRYVAIARHGMATEIISAFDGQFVFSIYLDGDKDERALGFAPDGLSLTLVNAAGFGRSLHLSSRAVTASHALIASPTADWSGKIAPAMAVPVGPAVASIDTAGRGHLVGLEWPVRIVQACMLLASSEAVAQPRTDAAQMVNDTCRQFAWSLSAQTWLQGFAALSGDARETASTWHRHIRDWQTGPGGRTLAHAAAIAGRMDVLETIKALKPDGLNEPDMLEDRPLAAAARAGQAGAAEYLIAAAAEVSHANARGETALMAAAQNGHIAVVALLLKAGANVSTAAHNGSTSLSLARQGGFEAVVELLNAAGASEAEKGQFREPPDTDFNIPAAARAETRDALALLDREGYGAYPRAADLFETASAAGDGFATYLLSRCYRFGLGRERDLAKAFDLVQAAEAAGDSYGVNELGNYYNFAVYPAEDKPRARTYYDRAAAMGNDRAHYNLAEIAEDDAAARGLYSKAYELGLDTAGVSLGYLMHLGLGGPSDPTGAMAIFERHAPNDANASLYLADMLENGAAAAGIPQDPARSRTLYEQAANFGNAEAMFRVARGLEIAASGDAGTLEPALAWYRRSAALGNNKAEIALGRLLSDGDPSVADSLSEALAWLASAEGAQARSRATLIAFRLATPPPALAQLDSLVPFPDDGRRKIVRYNREGQAMRIETPDLVTSLVYNPDNGKLARVTEAPRYGDGDWLQTDFTYDKRANLVRAERSDGRWVELVYPADSDQITEMKTDSGEILKFTYHPELGKPTRIEIVGVGSIDVTYDAYGEIEKVDSPEGHKTALRVTQAFQDLLTLVKPAGVSI